MLDSVRLQQLLESVIAWQSNPQHHPMTCGNDSHHPLLEPRIEGTSIVLRCLYPRCGYLQHHLPAAVMEHHTHIVNDDTHPLLP